MRCWTGWCRRLGALRRAALLLAAIVFATAATLHAAGDGHAEAATAHPQEVVHLGHGGAEGTACDEGAFGHVIDASASGGICGLCVPVPRLTVMAGPPEPLAVTGSIPRLIGFAASSRFRPPKLSATS